MSALKKLDFLLCGSPTPAFFSQMAFFKRSLQALGGSYADARVVCTFGDHDHLEIPPRWKRHFDHIEVEWSHAPGATNPQHSAQHDHRFRLIRKDADLAFLCDADVALFRPFDELLERLTTTPALAGVMAHYHFPWPGRAGNPEVDWPEIARAVIGTDIGRPHRYSLMPDDCAPCAPFYINYGMFAGTPDLFERFHARDLQLRPMVAEHLGHWWAPQVSLALACADLDLPTLALPMRFNFPNDPAADLQYPGELERLTFLHYLRTTCFRRDEIFADSMSFDAFLKGRYEGSNEQFRQLVMNLTEGSYPFS